MKELILAYQGEMTLKGLNRGKFEARLAKTIRWRLEPLGKFKVYQAQSTVFIEPKEDGLDMDEAFRRVSHVFGIVKLSRAVECPKDFAAICETAEAYLGETLRGIRTFKVEAKRADKTYPMKSPEICRELGAYLLDKHHHLRVDVHNPQLEIMVEIRDYAAYVHGPKVEAAGGLPVGTSGRALNLLSGGIDSPVAAWCMARRGLALHHIHFASPPYTSLRAKLKVRDLARELVESTMKGCHIDEYEVLPETVLGSELELMQYQHPFLDRKGLVILGDHVTLEGGTGCVHTAPGHGVEDFEVCVNHYPQVPVVVPVDDAGRLTAEAGEKFAGLKVWDANKVILEHIKESGHLMGVQHITHQYPHCWRCHHPIIFRATEQWFCSIDAFKEDVYKAIDSVHWQPAWGHDRMAGMVRDRSDWCISRQRVWGVPIPVFYCKKCGKYHITDASIKAVSDLFRKEGSDAWYKYDANDILPKTEVCECGASDWEKDPDIMDVWFDSGSTRSAVCRERPELRWPVDMYMEGADQFRGWFQSSLLTSVATQGVAPYREVLCHGWVVDAQGKQMHKSAGNGMEPSEIIRDYGADIIRLWVASSDYTVDVRAGKEIFRQLSEAYRKMRNTARFMLGNISDFDPAKDMVDDDQLFEIDHWALEACNKLTATMRDAYEHYDFSRAYHALYNFCVIDMSNFYMDVIKDRLYCADDHARRCAQTALYRILVDFTKLLAPILCFTSQEIWSYIPKLDGMKDYVVFEQMPEAKAAADEAFEAKWDRIMAIRDDVKKVLEQARADKVIGSALEAGLTLYCSKEVYDFLNAIPMDELADLFIVSHVDLVEGEGGVKGLVEGLGVSAAHAAGNKCLRCWKYETTVGEDGLCPRCAKVLKQ